MSARLLVVDDEAPIRKALGRILERAGHECDLVDGPVAARAALGAAPYDLVLCDVDMGAESGLDLAEHISSAHPDVAVVMVTGLDDPEVARVALDGGAYGYVIKPFERNEIVINVSNALRRRHLELENRAHREHLEDVVASRTAELQRSREEILRRLAVAAEHKDPETGAHLQRMSRYSALLGRAAGFDDAFCELIRLASPMHDVGKIGIPDAVLLKAGPFTDEDREVMRQHPEMGHRILSGSESELLDLAATIALTHHERFDGTGYPRGLVGDAIPIAGRIVAIADVFDALRSARRYKDALTFDEAAAIMRADAGAHFDPDLLQLFLAEQDDIEAVHTTWTDTPSVPV